MKTFFGVLGTAVAVGLFVLIGYFTGFFNNAYTMPIGICVIGLLAAGVLTLLTTSQREEYGDEYDISMIVSTIIAIAAVVGLLITGIVAVVTEGEWYVSQFMLTAVIYLAGVICILAAKSQDYPEFLTFIGNGVKAGGVLYAMIVGIVVMAEYGVSWYGLCFMLAGATLIASSVLQIIGTYKYDGAMMTLATLLSAVALAFAVICGSVQGFMVWEGWMTILSSLGVAAVFVFDIILQTNNIDWVVTGARNPLAK